MIRRSPRSTLTDTILPYTTLSRSKSRSREPVRLAASSFFPPETTMRFAPLLLALALAFPVAAVHGETRIPDAALAKAEQLREQALASDLGWKTTESLTTEENGRASGRERVGQYG